MDEKLAYIWKLIEEENITVEYDDIQDLPEKLHGMYIYRKDTGALIILDSSLLTKPREYRCTLTHETGHHFTCAKTNILYTSGSYASEIERSRDELRATKWATDHLMPNNEVYDAIKKYDIKNPQDLAEFFNVTIEFCMSKITYIKQELRKNSIFIKGRGMFNVDIWPVNMRE